ncbi:hypothetical protein SynROS8604_01496 [Synechococcus sp. ROS8604]|nr:hypothetical protein SynROS8604_01496 [Synechococcus sp. ROS8604]
MSSNQCVTKKSLNCYESYLRQMLWSTIKALDEKRSER